MLLYVNLGLDMWSGAICYPNPFALPGGMEETENSFLTCTFVCSTEFDYLLKFSKGRRLYLESRFVIDFFLFTIQIK